MKCVIVDDNKVARMAMVQLVSMADDLELVGECETALECFQLVKKENVDLLLLDIEMPGMSGIELTRHLADKKFLIIFTTAKMEYAVEAFELNVIDYLIKPISPVRFIKSIVKAREVFDSNNEVIDIAEKEFVFIKDSGILKRINIDDILFLEAMGDYVKLHTKQKFHVIHTTLKALEEKLPSSRFMRVHRSYISAINKIDFIEEGVINASNHFIPIADAYRSELQKRLNLL